MHQISHWKQFFLLLAAAGSALLLASCGTEGICANAAPAEEICEVFGPEDYPDDAVLSLLRQDKSIVRRQNERELRRMTGEKEGVLLQLPEGKEAASYEYLFRSPKALPEFRRAELTLSVLLPAGDEGKELSALLVDQEGELFQIPVSLPHGDGAWHELVFSVDGNTLGKMSRGGKTANRKVDPPLRLAGIAGDSRGIGLGVMRCRVLDSNAPLALELLTGSGSPIHVLKKGEEKSLELLLRNPRPLKPLSGVLKWSLLGVRGEPLAEKEEKISLEPGGKMHLSLPKPTLFGVYKLRMEVIDADPSVRKFQKEMSFAYLVPAGPTQGRDDGFIFGISDHAYRYSNAEQRKMAMAAGWCGVQAMREDLVWSLMQPTEGRWEFGSFDRVLKNFREYGIELMPIYALYAPWSIAKEWKPLKPKGFHARGDYNHWRKFVGTFAARYRDQVRYAEIGNEPDLYLFANFPENEYVRMLEIAYEEIKKAAPEWKVLNGGFSNVLDKSGETYNAAVIPAVVKSGKYDVFAFHNHSLFEELEWKLDKLQSYRNNKPLFMNETGLSSMVHGEEVQAQTLFRKLIYTWAKGGVGYNWYNLRNKGYDPANYEHNFGMLTMDFYPKPVYAAYNSLSNLYRGGKFLREIQLGSGLYGFLFEGRDGAQLLAAWSGTGNEEVQPLVVSGITGKAETVDLYGNAQLLPHRKGIATIEIGAEPLTLRVTGQRGEIRVAGALVRPVGKLKIDPGKEAVFTFELCNPEEKEQHYLVNLTLPEGLSTDAKNQTVQIAAGGTGKVSFPVRAQADFRSMPGKRKEVTLTFGDRNFRYRIDSVTPISAKGFRPAPDFVIDTAKQVQAWVPNSPDTAHLWWKGPQDLSAKVWLGRDGETLLLKAEVRDDKHAQPYSGSDVFKGDNIQFGFVLPGQNGLWEIGLTRLESGKSEVHVWLAPQSFQPEEVAAKIALETSRDEKTGLTIYEARIPFTVIGLTEEAGRRGFQFNLLVNDNDGFGRESFIAIAPGLDGKNTSRYPVVKF